ncbi:TRAP-type mannitol/chloroaromatic compound transport system permease small subunit [Streptomyces olivoverticillatus]|uniref:TRAP-type mannitol/chloroaromatic compound transport system permease small subunit n=1 Tax=Streptomyces olivoverticillatus TaxID=66427 RepID=A0A7W7LKB9_9ACTN|nr:hypothetical protein [Streptomyces olivoverticillatus]MBB4891807.1 TRAP-type mannitol/chloroaromatic compound transport system permease small subunit [Streptomyces olivoverticillatus]
MTQTNESGHSPGAAVGVTIFAAVMLVVAGVLDVLQGIMAIAKNKIFVVTPNYAFHFSVAGWGWVHLILGLLAVVVGLGLFTAATWARVSGMVLAGLLIIASFLSLPYYPFWSIILIALYTFIIWGLCHVRRDFT